MLGGNFKRERRMNLWGTDGWSEKTSLVSWQLGRDQGLYRRETWIDKGENFGHWAHQVQRP